jgi:tRNA-dihydrouridine synthase A
MLNQTKKLNHRFCIAPMLDWTDKYCRYFHRLLSQHTVLYTEMVTTGALIHSDKHRFLQFNQEEHPVALQLGGSNPHDLMLCAQMAEEYGYDEVNLNIGCPSDRVQQGRFGACLMLEPELVAECIIKMQSVVSIPVTIKCRIGVDNNDSYAELINFITINQQAGCETFIIHARKAWLNGLSPKENREIPPLHYDVVYNVKKQFPELEIIINGGITSLNQTEQHLHYVDGVMLGREAYHNPYLLAEVDKRLFNSNATIKTREQVLKEFLPYIQTELENGRRLNNMTRHILGLFHGEYGARQWRRLLSEQAHKTNAKAELILQALALTQKNDVI